MKLMTEHEQEREELEQQLKDLKYLIKFHAREKILEGLAFEQHINDILDMITEIEKRLKEL